MNKCKYFFKCLNEVGYTYIDVHVSYAMHIYKWTHSCNQHPDQELGRFSTTEAFVMFSSSHHSQSEPLSWLGTRSLLPIFVFYMNGIMPYALLLPYALFLVGSILLNTMLVKFFHIVQCHCCMVFYTFTGILVISTFVLGPTVLLQTS